MPYPNYGGAYSVNPYSGQQYGGSPFIGQQSASAGTQITWVQGENGAKAYPLAPNSTSQTAQTAQILADNARQTSALEQYLNPVPIPAYQVANPNCCHTNFGCGCGA